MAENYWLGKAVAVAQVDTVQVTAYHADTTYTLTVNGTAMVSVAGDTNANTTAAAISTAWNLVTHPYAAGITASVSTDTVTLTADNAGEPNVVTSSKSGTGTIGSVTSVTAATGPNHWDNADNWSLEAVPVTNDDVKIDNSAVHIYWGIDQSGMSGEITSLIIGRGYSGKIGLNKNKFLLAGSDNVLATEYREDYLKVKVDGKIEIGKDLGTGQGGRSKRIKIHTGSTVVANGIDVLSTDKLGNSADGSRPPVQLNATAATTDVRVEANCFVGIGVSIPGETATFGDIESAGGRIVIGQGVTWTNYKQSGGSATGSMLRNAATATLVEVNGGDATTEGTFVVTSMTTSGGTIVSNSSGTVTAATSTGGHIDFTRSKIPRTCTTPKCDAPGSISFDPAVMTFTNKVTATNAVKYTASTP